MLRHATVDSPRRPATRFGRSYAEVVVLDDGRPVRLAAMRREHAPMLLQGFDELSARSRHFRFFTSKKSLSTAEVRYLTEIDGQRHFAIVAAVRSLCGYHPAGVGRFVQLANEPEVAEPAVTVLDDYQGLGLGSVLLSRLLSAAAERGYRLFRADVLADNRRMLRALVKTSPDVALRRQGDVVRAELPLELRSAMAPRGTVG